MITKEQRNKMIARMKHNSFYCGCVSFYNPEKGGRIDCEYCDGTGQSDQRRLLAELESYEIEIRDLKTANQFHAEARAKLLNEKPFEIVGHERYIEEEFSRLRNKLAEAQRCLRIAIEWHMGNDGPEGDVDEWREAVKE